MFISLINPYFHFPGAPGAGAGGKAGPTIEEVD